MRVLGFCKEWDKLKKPIHTTFRYPRKDFDRGRDWAVGETVQEVYKPRSKERKFLQIATIIKKEPKTVQNITEDEAHEDGFDSQAEMWRFLKLHGLEVINKLTLEVSK